ncbi:hypothetical protein PN462_11715 [Spirulina sp. CS-785/01]|uniref:hypothetical protein n=1 Tax=Spirulina sp. CS-785/01 TaxID=3021716 RepID=UPI00232ED656|nr:hypothetical protein [Spirulina sp. CS-785/01]MDB9313769.1 hypothetical protein [Spirulina sp. CS-785/01]
MNISDELIHEIQLYLTAKADQGDSRANYLLNQIRKESLDPQTVEPARFIIPPPGEELGC